MLRKIALLTGVFAVLLCAAVTAPPAAGTNCSSTNVAAILAAIPTCDVGCWSAKDCALATGIPLLICDQCMIEMANNGLIGACPPPATHMWCLNNE
ncbi:MAG TPA: hypothetical protein VF173_09090 [Thermoanaerobaculia bacterium]|nr:hypothetical protein [Thermoanaerobaculia bacterium]